MEKNNKFGLLVGAGAIAGISFILLNPKTKSKVKDTSMNAKDSVVSYTQKIKDDPNGTKQYLIENAKQTLSSAQQALEKVQNVWANEGQEIKETAKNIVEDTKELGDHAKDVQEGIKDAKSNIDEAKNTAVKTGKKMKKDSKSNSSSNNTDHHVLDEPINKM
ncbi:MULTISPECIES: YtxH domain-containing protein [Oceanobacillus]|uniref:YtxH domain-containing protein n=1 Tax=Oceanobacillus aidingensis TaxID=645964 RepID=A0ABV9JWE3_9BACI|nr:YtxH domain-containing protein [Oceanobacillus oncorhynchi]MDM8100284.1 YtxH domain-containing protein [Oceanobacillus oncorhynchi]UUI40901.1 hypothetical protein NP440_04735 [Oceanobacillus oncorhynchi]